MTEDKFLRAFLKVCKLRETKIDWILVKWLFKNNFSLNHIVQEAEQYPLK